MLYEEGRFITNRGYEIFYQVWRPEVQAKAILQIAHGYAEHSGRYMNVVNKLIPEGYLVYANDHYGHGKSDGNRGYVPSFQQFIDDEYEMNKLIREKEGKELPIFMLGHSMGSLIAGIYAIEHQDTINGLVLSGCGARYPDIGFIQKIGIGLLNVISPGRTLKVDFIIDGLSHDPNVLKAYTEDPLVFAGQITPSLASGFISSLKRIKKEGFVVLIPLLIQKGSEDPLLSDAERLADYFRNIEDKTLRIYNGLLHEVYNEAEEKRNQVLYDLLDWLNRHV
jgi:alpha-beta hydrolase superfamily lysophospholipase